jgi:hypothetical protein
VAVSTVATIGCYVQACAVVAELFAKTRGVEAWKAPALSTLLKVDVVGLVYVSPMVCFVFGT